MTLGKTSPAQKETQDDIKKVDKEAFAEKLKTKDKEDIKEKKKDKNDSKKSEKKRGRPKTKKRGSSSSSSSSSSRSRSSSSSSSGSSSSSSSSAKSSKASGRSSSSSSSSSTSSTSARKKLQPRDKDEKRRRSKSLSPRRRRRSPSPRPKKIHVGRLTRNVNKDHLYEIFGLYGTVRNVDLPTDRMHGHITRGFAYIEFGEAEEAEKAIEHMDGGQIDGQDITVAPVLIPKARFPSGRRMSPIRRGSFQPWRRQSGFRPRDWDRDRRRRQPMSPVRRRSPIRRRSRSRSPPVRRRPNRRSSSSSSN